MKRSLTGLVISCALYFLWKKTWGTPLDPWDEYAYLMGALRGDWLDYSWGPLYTLWYRFLAHLLGPDPILLFRVGHFLVASATVLLSFALVRRLGGSGLAALVCAAAIAAWQPWLLEPTQVNHFNLALILLCLLAVETLAWPAAESCLLLGGLFFALVYARQDDIVLGLGFAAAGVALLALRFRRGEPVGKRWLAPLALLALVRILLYFWSPFKSRGFLAFADHYSWTHGTYGQGTKPLMERVFGHADSILGAARANPRAFFEYVFNNWFAPGKWAQDLFFFDGIIMAGAFLAIALGVRRAGPVEEKKPSSFRALFAGLLLLSALRAAINVSIFEPCFRYFFELVVVLGIFIASYFPREASRKAFPAQVALICLGLLLAAFRPWGAEAQATNEKYLRGEFTRLLTNLKSLPAERRKTWFASPVYSFYLGNLNAAADTVAEADLSFVKNSRAQFIRETQAEKFDVIVFDLITEHPFEGHLPREERRSITRALVTECYETIEKSDVAEVYVRKKDCHEDRSG